MKLSRSVNLVCKPEHLIDVPTPGTPVMPLFWLSVKMIIDLSQQVLILLKRGMR